MILGSHISLNKGNRYLVGVVEETISNGANTFMIFTGPPHNKNRVPIPNMFLEEARDLAEKSNIDFSNAVVHAPYIINLANPLPENQSFNIDQMVNEVSRTHEMGIPYIVLHPGYHVDQTLEEGLELLVKNLREVLKRIESFDVYICLETMAGKRNQIGKSLEEIAYIIEGCGGHEKLAVCLDTVHLHDAGYDLSNPSDFLREFNEKIGLERIKVLHLGDSANERGSRKDRHANFEYGHMGFDLLLSWAHHPFFSKMPIIIETPFWHSQDPKDRKTYSPYRHEIVLLRERKWRPIPAGYLPRNRKDIV